MKQRFELQFAVLVAVEDIQAAAVENIQVVGDIQVVVGNIQTAVRIHAAADSQVAAFV